MSDTPKKAESDPFRVIKYLAFCMSQTPPTEKTSYADFVQYAKWKLADARGYLMEDPIWDRYRDEQILIEYYAMIYERDKTERDKFESGLNMAEGAFESEVDWMDRQIRENQKAIEAFKQKQKEEQKDDDEFEYEPSKAND